MSGPPAPQPNTVMCFASLSMTVTLHACIALRRLLTACPPAAGRGASHWMCRHDVGLTQLGILERLGK